MFEEFDLGNLFGEDQACMCKILLGSLMQRYSNRQLFYIDRVKKRQQLLVLKFQNEMLHKSSQEELIKNRLKTRTSIKPNSLILVPPDDLRQM